MVMVNKLWTWVLELLNEGKDKYFELIFGIILGMFFSYVYHRFIGGRALRQSYEATIAAKDQTIASLNMVIAERLSNVTKEKYDKKFITRLKKFFRRGNVN